MCTCLGTDLETRCVFRQTMWWSWCHRLVAMLRCVRQQNCQQTWRLLLQAQALRLPIWYWTLNKSVILWCNRRSELSLLLCNILIFTRESRELRASLPSSGRLSVCPSVRLSVTLVICIKTVQARITKSSLWTAPRSLVYRDKFSCHWVQRFPSNEGIKKGYPPKKRRHFAVIGSNNVKTVADRYIHAAYYNKHWWQAFWIYQHRWPWKTLNPSKRSF